MHLIPLVTSLLFTPAILSLSWPDPHEARDQKVFAPLPESSEASDAPYLPLYLYPRARCPGQSYWGCEPFIDFVICRCFSVVERASGEVRADASPNARPTSLNVSIQLEPGNDDSRLELFELQCDDEDLVGCISRTGGFSCGCHGPLENFRLPRPGPTMQQQANAGDLTLDSSIGLHFAKLNIKCKKGYVLSCRLIKGIYHSCQCVKK